MGRILTHSKTIPRSPLNHLQIHKEKWCGMIKWNEQLITLYTVASNKDRVGFRTFTSHNEV